MTHLGRQSRTGALLGLAALLAGLVVALVAAPQGTRSADAAAAPPGLSVYTSDGSSLLNHGLAGIKVLLHPINLNTTNCGNSITFEFDATVVGTESLPVGVFGSYPNLIANVPNGATPGAHQFSVGPCINPLTGGQVRYTAPFTVDPPATTTTTRPTTTTTRPTTTTTTKKGTTTTTAKGATTTSTVPGSSTTTSTTQPGKHKIVVLPSPGDNPGASSTSYLKLDHLAISPGSQVTASGIGCDRDSPVTMTIGSTQVGQTTAGADGSFHAPLHLGSMAVGRYDVEATCGAVLTASFDVVLASRVDPGTSTTMIVIVFFILIGLLAFRRRLFPPKPTADTAAPPSEDEFTS
jgi:hypothetical protein